MSAKRRRRDNGAWRYSYGSRPFVVFAMERRDSANQVFVRWTNRGKSGREKRDRKGLGITVRDPETGRLDPKLVRAAELAVQQFQARLLVGRGASEETTSEPVRGEPVAGSVATPSGLTLRAGFDLALDPVRGKYGSNRTRRYDQMVKYRARLFGLGRHAAPLIDPSLRWTELTPSEARALWRKMADCCVAARGKEFGVRAAEGVVDALHSVAAWLRDEQRIPSAAARPPDQWRKAPRGRVGAGHGPAARPTGFPEQECFWNTQGFHGWLSPQGDGASPYSEALYTFGFEVQRQKKCGVNGPSAGASTPRTSSVAVFRQQSVSRPFDGTSAIPLVDARCRN